METNIKDIEDNRDIAFLIDAFYKKVIKDDLIGPFFTEVIKLDWAKHIPIMNDFWETVLFSRMKYKGDPMLRHIELNKIAVLKSEHFDRWLQLWKNTINSHFYGKTAKEAIRRAENIAQLMQVKLSSKSLNITTRKNGS